MKGILALALALTQVTPSGTSGIAEVTRELTRIEHRLAAAWKGRECAAWAALLAPDWSVIHVTGRRMTKSEALQVCEAPSVAIEVLEIDDILVRSFGNAAVVTGRTRVVTGGASPAEITLRFTDVFIRQGGQWRVVASQATRVGT